MMTVRYATAPVRVGRLDLNAQRVPHLFIITGAPKFGDPQNFPWTMPFHYSYELEGAVYAKYLLSERRGARVAILYQNDDFGKSLLTVFKRTLGESASTMIVAEASYELTDPTVDQQIISLKASGADTLVDFSTPRRPPRRFARCMTLAGHRCISSLIQRRPLP